MCHGRSEYLRVVWERRQREALAPLRTGSHWRAEETGRWARSRVPRDQRMCPHCAGGGEDVSHMLFDCPLYSMRLCMSSMMTCLPKNTPCSRF